MRLDNARQDPMLKIFMAQSEARGAEPVPVHAVAPVDMERFLAARPPAQARWLKTVGFAGRDGDLVLVPGEGEKLAAVVLGLGPARDPHALALLSERLPAGIYALGDVPREFAGERAAYAWAIGTYSYDRYRSRARQAPKTPPVLVLPVGVDGEKISRLAKGVFLARDLINTPANDMGPAELEEAALDVAERHGAILQATVGEELLAANYPLIHAVGRASARAPRLIDMRWGDERHPKVTLVGKGVCFDTGGLDLKTSSGMATMKKDMGGAACMLGLAAAVMEAKLPVRLRLLIPAVENSVGGDAFRPGDVLTSRKGLTVEIGNTDAEGRLVLADALADADVEAPDLLLCMATLTGAARAATGMEIPPFFTDDETLAADLMRLSVSEHDPFWRLPLWRSYEPTIESSVADLNNAPEYGLAGAITAALFLGRFVTRTPAFAHFDIPAWTDRPKPGRRKGAEANGVRALYALIAQRFGT
jgi:leucyl aminopeptidase